MPETATSTGVEARCPTADATRALARALGTQLVGGDVVVLDGPLGAGKTTFVQGLALGLGVTAPVTSPTFVLARHQRPDPAGPRPDGPELVHVDAYRLGGALELDDLDLDSDLDRAVVVVEWGGGLAERLSPTRVQVRLSRSGSDRASGDRASGDRAGGDRAGGDRASGDRASGDMAGGAGAGGEGAQPWDGPSPGDEPRTVHVELVGADAARSLRLTTALREAVPC